MVDGAMNAARVAHSMIDMRSHHGKSIFRSCI